MDSSDDRLGSTPVLIRRKGEHWRSPAVRLYTNEEMLKKLLLDSPQLLPTHSEGAVIVDEMTVQSIGSVDLTMVDPAGNITLVECKLGSNPEIRRSVIGQIFAYAAGCWQMTYADFERAFAARAARVSLEDAIRNALPARSREDWLEEQFRENVAENLASGRFTLVVAVDEITNELKRVIPYINSHTIADVQFLAFEIGYMRDNDVEILRPMTYGQESIVEKRAAGQRRSWSADAYFEKLREYPPNVQEAIETLVTFSKEHGADFQGGSGILPSLNVQFRFGDKKKTFWSSYFYGGGPTFDLNFDYIRPVYPVEALEGCARTMRSIAGVEKIYERLEPEFRARPSIPINPILCEKGAVETIQVALNDLLAMDPLTFGAVTARDDQS